MQTAGSSVLARCRIAGVFCAALLLLLSCGKGSFSAKVAGRTRNRGKISSADLFLAGGLQEEEAINMVHWQQGRIGEQQQQQQHYHHHHNPNQRKPSTTRRGLQEEPRVFPGGLELDCNLVVPGTGVAEGGPTIIEPAEGDVLVVGAATNVSWGLDIFEEGSEPDLDVGTVNVTLFNGDAAVWNSFDNSNTGDFSWTVPSDLEEARTYRVAIWDTASRICGISSEFGISGELSITVTQFEGYNEEGTVDISPLRRGNTSSGGGGEIYSCGGSVAIGWNHTGLLEEIDVRVCKELNTSGTLAGLEDEELQLFTCLDPVSDSVTADSSFVNGTLTTVEDEAATRDTLCAVWGEGFFARVSWAGDRSDDVFGLSNEGVGGTTVPVLGGVFLNPNDTTLMSILESQLISWDGRTGVGEDSQVDIILRSRASSASDDDFRVVVASNARTSSGGEFTWEEPWTAFTEGERASAETFQDQFYLELFDAVGGGLICRSGDFILVGESSSSSGSDFGVTSGAMMILVALGLFICCFFFCYFVPKRLRENARRVPPTPEQPEGQTSGTSLPALAAEDGRAETKYNHTAEGGWRSSPGLQAEKKEETWEELQEAMPTSLDSGSRSGAREGEIQLGT